MHRLVTVAAGLAVAIITTVAPAQAHDLTTYAYQGSDYAAAIGNTGDVTITDKECDGHEVRVVVWGKRFSRSFADANGCAAGSSHHQYAAKQITGFRVIERQDDGSWAEGPAVATHID